MTYTLKNFVDCTYEELEMVYKWRTSDNVASNSYNKQITLDEHINFVELLKTCTDKKYFIVITDDDYLGVISYNNITDSTAYIGYYKSPDTDTNGVGKILLELSADYAKNSLYLNAIFAEVIADNVASNKSMERAGFALHSQYDREIEDSDKAINVYIKILG